MTKILLYHLRETLEPSGFIKVCNSRLLSLPGNEYLLRHGDVASAKWWASFDSGSIPVKLRSGPVIHIGPKEDFLSDESNDLVCFFANGKTHCYDREGCWADPRIEMGDIISVLRTKVTIPSKYGDETFLIDISVELEKCKQRSG